MVKKAASEVGAFSEPVTKPVLEASTVLVKAVSDSAVKAYPHVKAGTVGVTKVAIDKSKSAVEFVLPHLKTGADKALQASLQVSGQALGATGDAIMSTPIGDKVAKPIDEKVVEPRKPKRTSPRTPGQSLDTLPYRCHNRPLSRVSPLSPPPHTVSVRPPSPLSPPTYI